eukprot:CAMPEP_0205943912 /NCGR_PEP_ID=MMETSP1325-20131115/61691_1 /ASSEMBLY_ACC=CAM_ASM_000708 /TAXON_ID=236786 /ORGANISM="Florenciella sp., Strain RCC1007" /LENGTH=60 /DNA_ID=CAMNT_0053314759 /DNA_START=53 /DNA_END=231 /DNA_ORIENTATION=+
MPEHTPTATVGEAASYMLSFRNPFPTTLSVDIVMDSDEGGADDAMSVQSRNPRGGGGGGG